jgi:hypothetical protein
MRQSYTKAGNAKTHNRSGLRAGLRPKEERRALILATGNAMARPLA